MHPSSSLILKAIVKFRYSFLPYYTAMSLSDRITAKDRATTQWWHRVLASRTIVRHQSKCSAPQWCCFISHPFKEHWKCGMLQVPQSVKGADIKQAILWASSMSFNLDILMICLRVLQKVYGWKNFKVGLHVDQKYFHVMSKIYIMKNYTLIWLCFVP